MPDVRVGHVAAEHVDVLAAQILDRGRIVAIEFVELRQVRIFSDSGEELIKYFCHRIDAAHAFEEARVKSSDIDTPIADSRGD